MININERVNIDKMKPMFTMSSRLSDQIICSSLGLKLYVKNSTTSHSNWRELSEASFSITNLIVKKYKGDTE